MNTLDAIRKRAEAYRTHGTPGLNAPKDRAVLLEAVETVLDRHRPIKIYDECECPEGTHPEEYDYIDCDSYVGCENSLIAIGCEECCSCGDYLTEECGEHHRHTLDPGDRCPTVRALSAAIEGVGE